MARTITISYQRRVNAHYARAIFQYLDQRGFDVYMEPPDAPSDTATLTRMGASAHVIVLLSHSALETWPQDNSAFRLEIAQALSDQRHLIILMVGPFNFEIYTEPQSPLLASLTGRPVARLSAEKLESTLSHVVEHNMGLPFTGKIYPPDEETAAITGKRLEKTRNLPAVRLADLQAEDAFEQAFIAHLTGGTEPPALEKTIALYDGVLAKNPRFAAANLYRGIARLVLHSITNQPLTDPIQDFSQALEIDPQYAEAFFYRGEARQTTGELVNAIQDYDRAVRLNPNYMLAWYRRAVARAATRDTIGARADLKRVLELNPDFADAHVLRRRLDTEAGENPPDQPEAVDIEVNSLVELDEYLRRNPDDADAIFGRGMIRQTRGDLHGAIDDFSRVIELRPRHIGAHMNRAFARRETGDIHGAAADYDALMVLLPMEDARWVLAHDMRRGLGPG